MKKTYITLGVIALCSALLTLVFQSENNAAVLAETKQESIVNQKSLSTDTKEQKLYQIYLKDQLIGVLSDKNKLDQLLDQVYDERYKKDFPDTKIGLGEDIHVSEFITYTNYENKDKEILAYLDSNDLFSVEAYKVQFSNGEFAYVKDLKDYEKAKQLYVLNFIDEKNYTGLMSGNLPPELTTYGTRYVSFKFNESEVISRALASETKILKDKTEILTYLSYGYHPATKYYTVQEGDTVQGIAWMNGDLNPEYLININSDKLKSQDQLLEAGMELNISAFNSPINVVVQQERLYWETTYPGDTEYIYDNTLSEGRRITVQDARNGYRNVKVLETYVNGKLESGEMISSIDIEMPQKAIIRVGTKVEPKVGSGNFRYPVDNPIVTCGWYCYSGHQAIDVQNRYNKWGEVKAADRGVVMTNSYHYISGYYMEINHNNGFVTYYGHMRTRGYIPVGVTVAKGQVIGPIGETGRAFGPHVHFEIRYNGRRVNPRAYL